MIEQITIRNFRSIDQQVIPISKVSVLVGANDAGKSNVLRALNLFFNEEVDPDEDFDFSRDYNVHSVTRSKTAREVSVELKIALPKNFLRHQKQTHVLWRRSWRADVNGVYADTKTFANGRPFASGSKLPTYLNRYRYTYIPAIKDRTFFSDLQGKMYDILASVAAVPLRSSASQFEEQLRVQLGGLLNLLNDFESSTVGLPESLREIFENLEIASNGIPLSRRGDGIKIRHIPKLLRFISVKQDEILNRGGVRYTHIWGFEEPENNVEMSSCFEMANELFEIVENNDNHQLFLTTHSPVFYGMNKKDEEGGGSVSTLFVDKVANSTVVCQKEHTEIDKRMGLMPLVAPYVSAAKSDLDAINSAREFAEQISQQKIPTLFVEGDTDKEVFELAFGLYRSHSWKIQIFSGDADYGSANALSSRALAWMLTMRHKSMKDRTSAIALFDQDDSGTSARLKLSEDMKKLGINTIPSFTIMQMTPSDVVKKLRSDGYLVPVELESLYTDELWRRADSRNWLEEREDFQKLIRKDLVQLMFETDTNPLYKLSTAQQMRMKKKFSAQGKLKAVGYLKSLDEAGLRKHLSEFQKITQDIEAALG
jgi:predicted ATPase